MFCSKCGGKLPDDSKFCPACGSEIISQYNLEIWESTEKVIDMTEENIKGNMIESTQNETILFQEHVNLFINMKGYISFGFLKLTDKRLIFERITRKFETIKNSEQIEIEINNIASYKLVYNIDINIYYVFLCGFLISLLTPVSKMCLIETKQGESYRFAMNKKRRNKLSQLLVQNIPSEKKMPDEKYLESRINACKRMTGPTKGLVIIQMIAIVYYVLYILSSI